MREALDVGLAALPEKYRVPLVLCYLQELSYEEAARRAGCSIAALRGRLERGKEHLRKRLARYGLPLAAPILILGRPPELSAALTESMLGTVRAWATGGAVPRAVGGLLGSTVRLKAGLVASAVSRRSAGPCSVRPSPERKPSLTVSASARAPSCNPEWSSAVTDSVSHPTVGAG